MTFVKDGVGKVLYGVAAEFDDSERLLAAIRAARELGYKRLEACTPFPVHGLDEALRLDRSKLGYVVLAAGLAGAAGALLLQWWTGTVGYPLVIGGKPLFAVEFSVPITFELSVLAASFAAVAGMLVFNGLPRFHHPVFSHPRFTGAMDDRFLLAIEAEGPGFDAGRAIALLESLGGRQAEALEA